MTNPDIEGGLLRFVILRWATLINVVLIYLVGIDAGPLILFIAMNIYSLLLILFWRKIALLVRRHQFVVLIDVSIAGLLITITGSSWASPYYLYGLASMVIAALIVGPRKGLALAIYLSVLYLVGFFYNEQTLLLITETNDYDLLITGMLAFIFVAALFGYPVNLIRSIHETEAEIAEVEDSLCETKELIAAVVDPNALSCRELEILESLSGGQTNAKIAAELHISEKTVKNHLYRIYKKLGISSREEAIIHYHNKSTPKNDNNR